MVVPHPNTTTEFVVVVVQLLSCIQLSATPQTAEHQASLSSSISQSLLKFTSIESVMPSNHLILCRPLPYSVRPLTGNKNILKKVFLLV